MNRTSFPDQETRFSAGMAAVFGAIVLFIPIAILVRVGVDPEPDLTEAFRLYYFDLKSLQPEPGERAVFLTALAWFPLVAGALYMGALRWLRCSADQRILRQQRIRQVSGAIVTFFLLVTFVLTLQGKGADGKTYSEGYGFYGSRLAWLRDPEVFFFGVTLFILAILRFRISSLRWQRGVEAVILIVMGLAIFGTGFWGIGNLMAMTDHFMVVLYPLSQVVSGNGALVDFFPQYGLYEHFLGPIFSIVGLTIGKLTFVMVSLTLMSFAVLYASLRLWTPSRMVRVLGFAATLWFTHYSVKCLMSDNSGLTIDPYFQFWPIRILFPALAVGWVALYLRRPSRWIYGVGFAVLGCGVFWNLDSGVPALLTAVLALAYRDAIQSDRWPTGAWLAKLFGHLASSGLAVGFGLLVSGGLIYGASEKWPDFSLLGEFQKVFYLSGHMMLPMPLVGPWNLAALIYLIGIVVSIDRLAMRTSFGVGEKGVADRERAVAVFTLSILGCGVFTYFQGRSHEANFAAAMYPALLLLTIWTGEGWTAWRSGAWKGSSVFLTTQRALLFSSVAVLFLFAMGWVSDRQTIMRSIVRNTESFVSDESGEGRQPYIAESLKLIRAETTPGEKVLMLSDFAALFHMVGRTSAVAFDDFLEMYAFADYARIEALLSARGVEKVFVGSSFSTYGLAPERRKKILDLLMKNYDFKSQSSDNNVILFQPKKP